MKCREAQQIVLPPFPFYTASAGNIDMHTETAMIIWICEDIIYSIFNKKIQHFY